MKKSKLILTIASVVTAGTCAVTMAACGKDDAPKSLRSQLTTPTNFSTNYQEGTLSFKAVENATYYRVYFYYIGEPDEDLGNTDYFASHTETVIETYPDGNTSEKEQIVYDKDENGNYVLKDKDTILSLTPTYSKRYNATYTDANGDKHSYNAGETVSIVLPNESIRGGKYYVGVRAGGPIALYTLSEYLVETCEVVLHNVTPEISTDYSTGFYQYGSKETTNTTPMGTSLSYTVDKDVTVLDGTGQLFEIANANSLYSANPNMELTYTVTDESGTEVSFTYTSLKMQRNDANKFCGWSNVEKVENVTTGKANISYYVYSHSGPTMFYTATSFFYVSGLEEGKTYTLHVTAPGDDGLTSYDSEVGTFTFVFTHIQESDPDNQGMNEGGSGGGGFPGGGGDFGGGDFPGGGDNPPAP